MKKLVLMLAVVFSASLFSCGNADQNAAAADSTAADTNKVEATADTTTTPAPVENDTTTTPAPVENDTTAQA